MRVSNCWDLSDLCPDASLFHHHNTYAISENSKNSAQLSVWKLKQKKKTEKQLYSLAIIPDTASATR